MKEESLIYAARSSAQSAMANDHPQAPVSSRISNLLSNVLDTFSFAFFCLSLFSLAHWFGSWCCRFIAEE
jgi:hypothetical protein